MKWMERAACRGQNINLFFPEIPQGDSSLQCWQPGLAFCVDCPVTRECADFIEPYEKAAGRRDGIYGGMTPKQRDQYRRKAVAIRVR